MANITKIKAKDPNKKQPKEESKPLDTKSTEVVQATTSSNSSVKNTQKSKGKTAKAAQKAAKKEAKVAKKEAKKATKRPMSKPVRIITWPFRMLAKPFIAFGRYVKASWHEIRQVRWPSRGATWKMVIAILAYAAIFLGFIVLLDVLFTFIFNNILGSK